MDVYFLVEFSHLLPKSVHGLVLNVGMDIDLRLTLSNEF